MRYSYRLRSGDAASGISCIDLIPAEGRIYLQYGECNTV